MAVLSYLYGYKVSAGGHGEVSEDTDQELWNQLGSGSALVFLPSVALALSGPEEAL